MVLRQYCRKNFLTLATYLVWGESGADPRRVAWTASRNLPTDDPALAAKFMRATAAQSARVERPAYHLMVGFGVRDRVDRELMERIADGLLEGLALTERQALFVAHRDRPHRHLHIVVNRVHPDDGRAWNPWHDWPRAREVAREQERLLGLSTPQFGEGGWAKLKERLTALTSELRSYERVTTLTREQYEAQLDRATAREARIRAELRALPDRAELERRIGSLLEFLWPAEIRRMRPLLTAPQFALAREVRRMVRSLARGREEEREHSR